MVSSSFADDRWNMRKPGIEAMTNDGVAKYLMDCGINNAFRLNPYVRCIDGGCSGYGSVALVGGGSFIPDLLTESQVSDVKNKLTRAGIRGVYSHEECGGNQKRAERLGLDTRKTDEYSVAWAKDFAGKMGLEYAGYITMGQMKRPMGLHDEVCAYIDGTGVFDPGNVQGLPPGFLISPAYTPPEYWLKELEMLIGISGGGHGFGNRFNSDLKFMLIVLGNPNDPLLSTDSLLRKVEKAADRYDWVSAEGFNAPAGCALTF